MSDMLGIEDRLGDMRRAFDASFAEPVAVAQAEKIDFVALRIGGAPHAIRTTEISGLHPALAVVRVPGLVPSLVGITGYGGEMFPVYDLAALLGLGPSPGSWAVIDAANTVALCFSNFDDHWRIDAQAVIAADDGARRPHLREMACHGTELRPIIDVPSVLVSIREQVSRAKFKE